MPPDLVAVFYPACTGITSCYNRRTGYEIDEQKQDLFGARLKAICSSDIGHWDGPMTEVVEEAYEFVDDGLITEADFRDLVFANPSSFYTETNPDFSKETAVEGAVETLLSP